MASPYPCDKLYLRETAGVVGEFLRKTKGFLAHASLIFKDAGKMISLDFIVSGRLIHVDSDFRDNRAACPPPVLREALIYDPFSPLFRKEGLGEV